MPRREWEDDPPRSQSKNMAVTVGVIIGAVVLIGMTLCVGLAIYWLRAVPDPGGPPAAGPAQIEVPGPMKAGGKTAKTYTRDEFKTLVMGKTADEVTALVGEPDRTSESGPATFWYYDGRTTDPASGKADRNAQLVFRAGKVTEVSY